MNAWQPITTAPTDRAILCYWTGTMFLNDDWRYGVAKFSEDLHAWIDPETEEGFFTDPTHWMPLPAAPVTP